MENRSKEKRFKYNFKTIPYNKSSLIEKAERRT